MMGYLFLAIALLCGAIKGYCGKKTSGMMKRPSDSFIISLVRMIFCIGIGIITVLLDKDASLALPLPALLVSLAAGVTSAVFVITWILSVRTGAYMMVDVFLTAGVIIPIVSCSLMYGEEITLIQIIGCALILVAVFIMCSYNNSLKAKITLPSLLLLLLCGAANGCTDLLQKVYMHDRVGTVSVFSFYTYVSATVTLAVCVIGIKVFEKLKESKAIKLGETVEKSTATYQKLDFKHLLPYIAVMAACLFFNSFCKTLAADSLDAIVISPISQVGGMLLSSLMAVIFFKEKLNKKGILGIVVALAAMLLINIPVLLR